MNRVIPLLLVGLLLFAGGCASVHVTQAYNGVAVENGRRPAQTVEIENSGWYILTFIPVASGDPNNPNRHTCRWFTDTVKLENNIHLLDQIKQRERVTEVANLTSHRSDEKYLVFLVARRAYHTSAVLLKPEQKPVPVVDTDRK